MALTAHELERFASIRTIDITTTGRNSGMPRRLEIWWFRVDGRFIISGTPGRRDWLANLKSDPKVTIHVDGRDLAATAKEITDPEFRRRFFTGPTASWYATQAELDELIEEAPMIEILFS